MCNGINNQKFALLGLLHQCLTKRTAIALPAIVDFTPGGTTFPTRPFDQVFDIEAFRMALEIFETNQASGGRPVDSWECFKGGTRLADRIHIRDETAGRLVKAFFHFLTPLAKPPSGAFDAVVQLRVERDWIAYANERMRSYLVPDEVLLLDPIEILASAKSSLNGIERVYVCYDDRNVDFKFDALRESARDRLGVSLFSKRDFGADFDLSNLDLSLIDFEVAATSKVFVGTTRSTFSNLAALTAYSKGITQRTDWVYNLSGGKLIERVDAGIKANPRDAISTGVANWFRDLE
jgi:hypothetical protein